MESLSSLSFHALSSPDPASGLSVFHALCIKGDVETTEFILHLCPSVVDLVMALDVSVLSSSTLEYKGKKLKEILEVNDGPSHKRIQELLIRPYQGLDKWPLLHIVARCGTVHDIDKLISSGVSISVYEREDHTSRDFPPPLHVAAEHNSVEVVKKLLDNGASLYAGTRLVNFSAIHYAAKAGRTETVSFMLDRDINLKDALGGAFYTPLHVAAWEGQTETVALLVYRGADINDGWRLCTYEGMDSSFYPHLCGGATNHLGELTECESKVTPILLALRKGHLKTFNLLEKHGAFLAGPILFLAVKGGSIALLKKLVDAGHDAFVRDKENRTLLHFAKNVEQGEYLLSLGIGVNSEDRYGLTPLHFAAHIGDTRLADLLIKHGARISVKGKNGHTPLVFAVRGMKPNLDVVMYFVQKLRECGKRYITSDFSLDDCDDISPEVVRMNSSTPLHNAATGGPKIVQLLLENGAKLHVTNNYGEMPFQQAAQYGKAETLRVMLLKDASLIKAVDWRKRNALFSAIAGCNSECVRFLLDCGCKFDIKDVDNEGNNSLQLVIVRCHDDTYLNIAEMVLEHIAISGRKDEILKAVNKDGWTALHSAAACGNIFMARLLLRYGFSVNAVDKTGKTPMFLCKDKVELFNHLVENGADLAKTDKKGNFLLHNASTTYDYSTVIVDLLLDRRPADVHFRNAGGETPLHIAVKNEEYEKAKMILGGGADVNAADKKGRTPLHVSAKYSTACHLLVERGANVNAVDHEGNTPLHVAALENYINIGEELLSFFIEHGGDVAKANKKGKTPVDFLPIRHNSHSNGARRFARAMWERLSRR